MVKMVTDFILLLCAWAATSAGYYVSRELDKKSQEEVDQRDCLTAMGRGF